MTLRESIQASLGPTFTVERELELPGTSAAFVAHDSGIDRDVVVQVLSPDLAGVIDLARFKREIGFAARLEDPNIVPVLSAGDVNGQPYVVSSFIDGDSLRTRVAAGQVPSNEALRILRDVASALAHGHERGVLHRDLRLDDVIVTDGSAMVANFGVARAIFAAGGPGDATVDNRSDLRAFGAIGYELLTGHAPVGDPPEPIQKFRPSPPTGLAPLIMRCLNKNPAQRPQTASEVVRELDEILAPSDGLLASLWPVESSTLVARSDYYKRRGIIAMVAVVIAMSVAGYFAWRTSSGSSSSSAAAVPTKTIAVLPFANAGGDNATLYFTQGFTEELRAALARVPGADVAGDDATAAAASIDSGSMKAVGERLHVGAVVVGQVSRLHDRVQLTVQLRNASDTAVVWKSNYDVPSASLFQLENDVARAIAGALHLAVKPGSHLADGATASDKAHDFYLQGKFLENRHTDLEISQSLGMFQQALKQDPKYVAAWVGVADCWARLADDFVAPKEAVPHLRDAVAHGLALDSTNAALRFMHGRIAYLYDRDAHAAQAYMQTAVAADPNVPDAIEWFPQVLWTNGSSDSARAFVRHGVDRDSLSPITLLAAWRYAKTSGNALDALEYCSRLEVLRAGTLCDALQQLDIGRSDQAVGIFQQEATDAGPRGVDAQLAYVTALVAANRTEDARKLVAAVDHETTVPGRYMREDDIALMHGMLGDSTGALRWYDKALAAGSSGIGALYWRTAVNPLRKDPQLLDLAKRAGLASPPSYWP
ncbi:MAG TPA: protein kinase [Gemmatimonadaceae bacterium]